MSFSFGTPGSAPATSGLTGGFNFSTAKPATPGFGLTATSQPSTGLFGNTSATATPAFGSTFGTATTPGFGATTTPAFGATSTAPAFGAAATPGFGSTPAFGATATPAFGATTTPAFGATATPAFGATTTPAFGATTTPAFGATTTPAFGATTTPAFGATTTPAFGATTTPAFGTGSLSFGAGTNTAPTTGLAFGTTTTATSTGLGGLGGFGANTTTSGFGLFGSTGTATTSTSLFGNKLGSTVVTGTLPSISAAPSLGLGGMSTVAGGLGAANTTSTTDGKGEPPKQTKLPNEISAPVGSFKEFVKKQKALSSDVMRISIKPLHKVSQQAEEILRLALSLSGEVSRGRAQSRRLRAAAASALAAAETAARDPPGSELEGSAPPRYVKELISELEQQLITFRRQMDVADKQMQASPKLLSEQELTLGIRRMHESLIALAGRLQAVHTQVEAQKEQYLNLRKYILKDPNNVFEDSPRTSLDQILDAEDSRKKMKSGGLLDTSLGSAVLTDPRAALGSIRHLSGPTPFSYLGTLSPFSAADTTGTSWQPQSQQSASFNTGGFGTSTSTEVHTGFQLQKPPGKRVKQ